jgi:hypothetical protein
MYKLSSFVTLRLLHILDFRERPDMPSWFSQNIRAQLDFRAIHELRELYAESTEPLMSIVRLSAFGIVITDGQMNEGSTLTVQLVL